VRNEGEHEDAINLEDLGSPVQSRLIIQLPESSPAPKIEILDDRQNPVLESDPHPSSFLQTQNPKGEKEDMKETLKKEEKDDKTKEKKSLMKKLPRASIT